MGVAQTVGGDSGPSVAETDSPDEPSTSDTRIETNYQRGADAIARLDEQTPTWAPMQGLIKGIGGALITAFMVIVVLSLVFDLQIVQNASGPFGNLTDTFADYGVAALSLVGVGIIVGAAAFAMDMFGGAGR